MTGGSKGVLVDQFPTMDGDVAGGARCGIHRADNQNPNYTATSATFKGLGGAGGGGGAGAGPAPNATAQESAGRNPYREAAPRPPEPTNPKIAELEIEPLWPACPPQQSSVSRDEPEKLSAATRAHSFYVRTKKRGILTNIDVLGFIAKCPDAGDGEGIVVHRDVILSLAHHLIDKVHELEELREGATEPRYDGKLSAALDKLGDKDAEIKELRAALGEAAVKIRRLEKSATCGGTGKK